MSTFTPQILRFDSLPSTNVEAARRAVEGAPEGLCVVASEQTAGRGRRERHWVSPKDAGLYFSIILRPQMEQSGWPLLTLMAGVAVYDALLDSCGLVSDIKWPNDILANGRKLCGILAETVDTAMGRAVVVGIGINLRNKSFPSELDRVATSIEAETGEMPNLEAVLDALIRAFAWHYQVLQLPAGPEDIVTTWSGHSSYGTGKQIQVTDTNETFAGTTRGLERDGALRVETDAGEIRIVRAGDVASVRPSDAAGTRASVWKAECK
ncbi:MAG: biotin--[acetyl-CoA-carboxylase] ligase [Acidobacteriota bacterium]|nr:biotin--[acetyl-CoA-carboxylase] ligase [Acidobacteriota bacterium]